VLQRFSKPEFFVAQSRIAQDRDTIRNQEETIEQHRVYRVVAHAAVHEWTQDSNAAPTRKLPGSSAARDSLPPFRRLKVKA
jgi:hypothetical protein